MNKDIEKYIKNIVLESLLSGCGKDGLEKLLKIIDEAQSKIATMVDKMEDLDITNVKVMTIMTFSILNKLREGKKLGDFSNDDWAEIVKDVSEYVAFKEDDEYVVLIFKLYEGYIRASANYISNIYKIDKKKVACIIALADELEEKTKKFKEGEISELLYIEESLWISLEAMVKMVAVIVNSSIRNEYGELICALVIYVFEHGRFSIYEKELKAVREYISMQQKLDEELQRKYDAFMEKIDEQSKEFIALVDNAFDPNFRKQFVGSIDLAKSIGIPKKDILTSMDEIDAFFK